MCVTNVGAKVAQFVNFYKEASTMVVWDFRLMRKAAAANAFAALVSRVDLAMLIMTTTGFLCVSN